MRLRCHTARSAKRIQSMCHVSFAPQRAAQGLRMAQALARIRPSFFSDSFSDTTHGDDQPPGREHHSMNRSLNT